jgi:hypothetical protein
MERSANHNVIDLSVEVTILQPFRLLGISLFCTGLHPVLLYHCLSGLDFSPERAVYVNAGYSPAV